MSDRDTRVMLAKRSLVTAIVLSVVIPGAGHLYAGATLSGVAALGAFVYGVAIRNELLAGLAWIFALAHVIAVVNENNKRAELL